MTIHWRKITDLPDTEGFLHPHRSPFDDEDEVIPPGTFIFYWPDGSSEVLFVDEPLGVRDWPDFYNKPSHWAEFTPPEKDK